MINLQYGLVDESYKWYYGVDYIGEDPEVFIKNREISLIAARRDWAAFQVLLKGNEDFTVTVGDAPVFLPKGPLANVRLKVAIDHHPEWQIQMYLIGFVEDDDRLMKADMLLKDEAIYVESRKVQPVWIEVNIPEDAKAGVYTGKVHLFANTMFEDEIQIGILEFKIDVKDVLMPVPQEYTFHLDLWQHPSNIARKHEVRLWSQEHFEVLERYIKCLSELGQKTITVYVSEIPWSGQRCFKVTNYLSNLFEYSIVQVEKTRDGRYHYDFSKMERYIRLCFKYGIKEEIELFGLTNIWVSPEDGYGAVANDYPEAIRIRYFDQTDNCYKYMRTGKEIKEYIKALEQFFIEKTWIEKVRIVADEPVDVNLYRKRVNLIKEIAPSFRHKITINHAEFIAEINDEANDFVPIFSCLSSQWELIKQIKDRIKGRLMWYVCCWPPIPNTFISSPLLESRLIGILTAYMNLDGFLRWNFTAWPERPRERISYRYPHWKAGDTNFVYPANDGRPILTLRYKNLKRGIEDYELISMVERLYSDADKHLQRIWDILLHNKDIKYFHPSTNKKAEELYSLNYEDYKKARAQLLELIVNAQSPSR